jgi:hypothetical protein
MMTETTSGIATLKGPHGVVVSTSSGTVIGPDAKAAVVERTPQPVGVEELTTVQRIIEYLKVLYR